MEGLGKVRAWPEAPTPIAKGTRPFSPEQGPSSPSPSTLLLWAQHSRASMLGWASLRTPLYRWGN